MTKTVSFRYAEVMRSGALVPLIKAADFSGQLRIQVENVGLYPLQVHRGINAEGGQFFLNAGRRIQFSVDSPVNVMISPVRLTDTRGKSLDYIMTASAVIEGESFEH